MVFPTLLCPHSQLQHESPVSCATRIWRTAMFTGYGRKSATTRADSLAPTVPVRNVPMTNALSQRNTQRIGCEIRARASVIPFRQSAFARLQEALNCVTPIADRLLRFPYLREGLLVAPMRRFGFDVTGVDAESLQQDTSRNYLPTSASYTGI